MNSLITAVLDRILAPLREVHPVVTLACLAAITGVGMLLVFRFTSNQRGIARAKARVVGHLLAIRLFKDDPWITLRCLGRSLVANLGYLRHAMIPLLVMILPVAVLLIHLESWFGGRPLGVDEKTRVAVRYPVSGLRSRPDVVLLPSPGHAYECETPPLHIPALNEINWRIRVLKEGVHALHFKVNGDILEKRLVAGGGLVRLTPVRTGGGLVDGTLYPGEPGLAPGLGLEAVSVDYPERPVSLLGVSMPWWMAYFLLAIVFAFVLKKPLRVEA